MTNNDVLRRIRYIFNLSDSAMMAVFGLGECEVTREQVSDWLKKEDDPAFEAIDDSRFASFLNGLIIDKRGKKEGPQPAPEKRLNNNLIFLKLKIALNLQADDVYEIMELADFSSEQARNQRLFSKTGS